MLEIIFDEQKKITSTVKVVCIAENKRINSSKLSKEDNLLLQQTAALNGFCGKLGSILEVNCGKNKIVAVGCGTKTSDHDFQIIGAKLFNVLYKIEQAVVLVEKISANKLLPEEIAHNMAFGLLLGSYRFDKYFTQKKAEEYPTLERVYFNVQGAKQISENFKHYAALANAVRYAKDLCNEPANYLTPIVFADDIKRLEYLGLDIEILGLKELREHNFNLLLSVSQGSIQEPRVAIIKWKGNPDNDKWDLALVGKGVTFDSGGISIKPASGMEDMKQDMTGAAVVVASLKALALQCAPKNVIGIVGLVENMPSGSATRPGDIVTSMSGQTVEIINTDAEGRLVLADCLWFVQQQYGAKKIIDIATLTGSIEVALGGVYAGLFSNNSKLNNDLISAGQKTGELLWSMPLGKEYNKNIKSNIADMVNISKRRGDACNAASFLQKYIKDGVVWAHLDTAGVEMVNNSQSSTLKGATAFGVRLLNYFINE